jgi:hypothetical protein
MRKIFILTTLLLSFICNSQTYICKVSNKPYVDPGYKITIDGVITNVSCNGEKTGSIIVTASGGKAPYKYYWNIDTISKVYCYCEDDDIGVYVFSKDKDLQNAKALTYRLKVVDANGITVQRVFSISEPKTKLFATSINSDPTCSGDMGHIYLTKVEGGVSPYNFKWSDNSTNQNLTSTSGIYKVDITDANGCKISLSDTINDGYKVNLTPSFSYNDKKFSFNVQNGKSPYIYNVYDKNNKEILNSNLFGGYYRCKVTDKNGCTDQTKGFIIIKDSTVDIDITSTYDNFKCFDGFTKINNSADGGKEPYIFTVYDNKHNKVDCNKLKEGSYIVEVKDANGFIKSEAFDIKNNITKLEIKSNIVKSSTNITLNGEIDIEVKGGKEPYTYKWDDGSTKNKLEKIKYGNYNVSITDKNGCILEQQIYVDYDTKITNDKDDVEKEKIYLEDSYPNPYFTNEKNTSDKIIIGYKIPEKTTCYIHIINQAGNIVKTYSIKNDDNKIEIDASNMKPGIYSYILVIDNKIVYQKKITILN